MLYRHCQQCRRNNVKSLKTPCVWLPYEEETILKQIYRYHIWRQLHFYFLSTTIKSLFRLLSFCIFMIIPDFIALLGFLSERRSTEVLMRFFALLQLILKCYAILMSIWSNPGYINLPGASEAEIEQNIFFYFLFF